MTTPYAKHTIRIDLAEIGEDGKYIVLNDPKWLTPAQIKAAGEDGTKLAGLLVAEWNVPHAETGEVLPLPGVDPEASDNAPGAVLLYLRQRIEEAMSAPLSVTPKANS